MSILHKTRRALKHLIFGETALPEEFTVGIVEPQTEIALWLHGMGAPIDVTSSFSTACSDPFVLCLSFAGGTAPAGKDRDRLSLKFCERSGQKRVLGEIGALVRRHGAQAVGELVGVAHPPVSSSTRA